MKQNNLFDFIEMSETAGKKILTILEEGIHKEYGFKNFCYDIKREEPQVRDALNGNGKYFSATWLPVVLQKAPIAAGKLINLFCDLASFEHPEPKTDLTPEKELELYKKKVSEHGLQTLFKDLR